MRKARHGLLEPAELRLDADRAARGIARLGRGARQAARAMLPSERRIVLVPPVTCCVVPGCQGGRLVRGGRARRGGGGRPPFCFLFLFSPARPPPLRGRAWYSPRDQKRSALPSADQSDAHSPPAAKPKEEAAAAEGYPFSDPVTQFTNTP